MLTGQGLANFAISLLGSPYMYGVNGLIVTEDLIQSKARQYPAIYTAGYITKCRAFIGQKAYDCSSITDLYMGTDRSANGWLSSCIEKGPISTIPDIIGLIVHRDGHMGVYVGGGYAVEARGIDYGVVKTKVVDRTWTSWGKLSGVEYSEVVDMLKKGDKGLAVTYWQKSLLKRDPGALPVFGADSDFGEETAAATTAFQAGLGLPITGMVDDDTWAYMCNFLLGVVNPDLATKLLYEQTLALLQETEMILHDTEESLEEVTEDYNREHNDLVTLSMSKKEIDRILSAY